MPYEAVVRCGLAAGRELDRPLLRRLRAELRRAEALEAAGRALGRRSLSRQRLGEGLRRRGVPPPTEREVLATLASVGLLDDARLARERAEALAQRGWGDAAIEARLEAEGLGREHVAAALGELPPERVRATALAGRSGNRRTAWKALARHGFSSDAIEAALGPLDEETDGGLG